MVFHWMPALPPDALLNMDSMVGRTTGHSPMMPTKVAVIACCDNVALVISATLRTGLTVFGGAPESCGFERGNSEFEGERQSSFFAEPPLPPTDHSSIEWD